MKKKILILILIASNFKSFAQIKELDNFREQLTYFIKNNSQVDNSKSITQDLDKSFREFVLLKDFSSISDVKDFEKLKKTANNNSMNYLYSFFELSRDNNSKSNKNNINYYIGFFGLYDYESPNIVSIYMQPHSIGNENFMIYYYKMNNKGTYFIKNITNNEIVFESEALTSNAPIVKFDKIDDFHYLIVEDMGDNGQRGIVIKIENKKWTSINAFKGKSFDIQSLHYDIKKDTDSRKYLWIASNRKITAHLKDRPFELSWIYLDDKTKNISYKKYNMIWKDSKNILSKWNGVFFSIDDYFIGEDYIE